MNPDKFNIEEALGFGWRTMTSKFGKLFLFIILPVVGSMLVQLGLRLGLGLDSKEASFDAGTVIKWCIYGIVHYVIQVVLVLGMTKAALRLGNDEEPQWSDYANPVGSYVSYFVASLLYGLMVGFGCVLLLVPGIILGIMFQFYIYAIADKRCGPIEALGLSNKLTNGAKWKLFLYGLISFVIFVAGLICLVVGVIPASLVVFMATTHIYKQLSKSSDGSPMVSSV